MQFQLILLAGTAIEVRLSHASLRAKVMVGSGVRLSNTWLIYPEEELIPGNWG